MTDLTPLAGLTTLETLVLISTDATDASPLVGLTNLRKLWIGGSPITNLEVLDPLKKNGLVIDTTEP